MGWKEDFIGNIEKTSEKKVSWKSEAEFFADNRGNIMEGDVIVCQIDYDFYFSDGKSTASFFAPDINFKDIAKKKDALAFIEGKTDRLKNTSLLFSVFAESVKSYEFEGGYVCFVKTKGNQLNQLIDIAISKQKYSLSEYNRLHPNKG